MKRFFALALLFGSFSVCGFVGCGDEAKVETTKKIETPEGTKTETDTHKVEATGDMKPADKPADAPK